MLGIFHLFLGCGPLQFSDFAFGFELNEVCHIPIFLLHLFIEDFAFLILCQSLRESLREDAHIPFGFLKYISVADFCQIVFSFLCTFLLELCLQYTRSWLSPISLWCQDYPLFYFWLDYPKWIDVCWWLWPQPVTFL